MKSCHGKNILVSCGLYFQYASDIILLMQPSGRYFNNHILLITILAIGVILRFYGLDIQSLWLDELITWSVSNQGKLIDVIEALHQGSTHPPGYFSIIYFVIKYLGDSETLLRLLSAICGVISIVVIFLLGRLLYSNREGIISAALTAVLWCPVYYSQEARSYSILLLFILLATYFWILILRCLDDKTKMPYYVIFGYLLTAIISSYLHYLGFYLIMLQCLGAVFFFSRRPTLSYILLIYSLIFLAYSPWLPVMWDQINSDYYSWIKPPEFNTFAREYLEFLFNKSRPLRLIVVILYIFLFIRSLLNIIKIKAYRNIRQILLSPGSLLLLWLIVPFALIFIKSILSTPVLTYRNLIISLPPAYILLARSITQLPIILKNRTLTITTCIITGLLLYHLIFTLNYYSKPHKTQFREAVYYVIEHDTDLNNSIIASSYGHLIKYYFLQNKYDKNIIISGGPFSYSGIEKEINEKRPYYVWYINSHNFPTEEYAYDLYKNFDLSLVTHKRFLQVDVWLFHTNYLRDIDGILQNYTEVSYLGFYDPEKWPPKYYTWRWSKKEGIISIPKKDTNIELTLQCNHPDIEKDPVTVDLFLNNEPLDKVTFINNKRFFSKRYYIPSSIKGIPKIRLNVSRTWNPHKYGISRDDRNLGIAVREIKFIDNITL